MAETPKLKEQRKKYRRKWYSNPRVKITMQEKHWRYRGAKNLDGSQFTMSDYDKLFIQQDGKCALCDKHQSECKHAFCADHNHASGRVRSLLCKNCNGRLAMFENKEFAERCKLYLAFRSEVE